MEVEEHSIRSDQIDVKSLQDSEAHKIQESFENYDIPPTVKWLLYPDDDEETEDIIKNPDLDQDSEKSDGKFLQPIFNT